MDDFKPLYFRRTKKPPFPSQLSTRMVRLDSETVAILEQGRRTLQLNGGKLVSMRTYGRSLNPALRQMVIQNRKGRG